MGLRSPLLLSILVALVAAGAGCAGDDDPMEPPDGQVVEIRLTSGLRFSPADVTIDPGTTVRWVNDGAVFHTVTPNDPQQTGVWTRATTSAAGVVLTHTFSASGQTYTYHCEPHVAQGMTGVIRVR